MGSFSRVEKANTRAEEIVGMRRNRQPAAFVDQIADLACRIALSDKAAKRQCKGDDLPRW